MQRRPRARRRQSEKAKAAPSREKGAAERRETAAFCGAGRLRRGGCAATGRPARGGERRGPATPGAGPSPAGPPGALPGEAFRQARWRDGIPPVECGQGSFSLPGATGGGRPPPAYGVDPFPSRGVGSGAGRSRLKAASARVPAGAVRLLPGRCSGGRLARSFRSHALRSRRTELACRRLAPHPGHVRGTAGAPAVLEPRHLGAD